MESPTSFSQWPKEITGNLAWTGADFESNTDAFTDHLSSRDIAELNAAVKHFQGLGLARGHADPTTFPLSQDLATRLRGITDHVYNGQGFRRLRGINPAMYTDEERVILYAGITSYVADQRARNIEWELTLRHSDHIRDRSRAQLARKLTPLELAKPMTFHTDIDVGDMVSLFVQSTPLEGGDQYLAPIASIYNDLMKRDPEVLRILSENWYWERVHRPGPDQTVIRTFNRPVIGFHNNQLQINMAVTFLGANPAIPFSPDAPQLTEDKIAALNRVQEAATRVNLRIVPEAGDLLFINNFAVLHARAGFVDSPDDVWKQRYIMRLWLHDSHKGWESAPVLQRKLDETFDLAPAQKAYWTGDEMAKIEPSMRIRQMGLSSSDDHD
ncbi:hypothetical protein QBC40DRAFT_219933 [Triangularia verruculosa]|uniref:TauD/TfdA-like domain-containing protein n=1 Tax=Triangularia verruculosa TaxID=2587418 RepID=A0AAN6XME1_9PEZI|nr:hypothetical protein QBC40DRAFT_219933 [Triangularia verruculosa]